MDWRRHFSGLTFLKHLLNVYNVILLLIGFCILNVTIWTLLERYDYVALLPSQTYPILVNFLLFAGILLILLAFLGCCIVAREHQPLLLLYIFLLLLILLIEVMVGILTYLYEENLSTDLELNLNETLLQTYNVDTGKTQAVDFLQATFHCCGAITFRDWSRSVWIRSGQTQNKVPDSCCKSVSIGCGKSDHPSNIYYPSCLEKVTAHLSEHLSILSTAALTVSLVELFGIIIALKMYLKLKHNNPHDCAALSEKHAFI